MDELSLLVADSIESAELLSSASTIRGLESAVNHLPAPDFTGSLAYIDSLTSRSALALSRRDLATIATALSTFDYFSPLINSKAVPGSVEDRAFNASTDFRPLGDARRFDPEVSFRPPRALSRAAPRVTASRPLNAFPPGWRNPLDPTRDPAEIDRALKQHVERSVHPWARKFEQPNRTVICLKRKVRKGVMHAFGFAGLRGFRPARRNYWSRVFC